MKRSQTIAIAIAAAIAATGLASAGSAATAPAAKLRFGEPTHVLPAPTIRRVAPKPAIRGSHAAGRAAV